MSSLQAMMGLSLLPLRRYLRLVAASLGMTLAYAAMFQLGYLSAQTQHTAPLFWPASGLALAGAIVGGWPMVFSVLIGAFIAHFGLLGGPAFAAFSPWGAFSTALGAIAQAWLGALLLRRFVGELPPMRVTLVLRAMLLCGLIALLGPLSASIGLYLSSTPAIEHPALFIWRWWISIYVGILIITPGLVVVARGWRRQLKSGYLIWPGVSLVLGLVLLTFVVGLDADLSSAQRLSWDVWARLLIGLALVAIILAFIGTRQRAEGLLRQSQANLETAQALAGLGSWEHVPATGATFWSQEMYRLWRRNPAAGPPSREEFLATVCPEDRAALLEAQERAVVTGERIALEFRSNVAGSEVRYYEATIHAIRGAGGEVARLEGTALDITARRRAAEEITHLSRVIEQMEEEVIITDVRGVIQYVNPAFERQLGYRRAEVVGRTPRILKSGLEEPAFYEHLWSTIARGEPFRAEFRNRCKDGRVVYEDKMINPIRDEHGVITHFVATGKDITARKQMEHELQKRLKELTCLRQVQHMLELAPPLELLGRQVVASLVQAMQFPATAVATIELEGYHYSSSPLAVPAALALSAPILAAGSVRGQLSVTYADGSPFLLPEEQNLLDGVAYSLGLWLEHRQAQETLTSERNSLAQRVEERTADLSRANLDLAAAMRAKDEFFANMSHELRTPLNAILGLSEALLEQYRGPLNVRQQEMVGHIDTSGRHLLTLINDILDLSKIEAGHMDIQREAVALSEVCEASLLFVKQQALKKRLQLSLELNDRQAHMEADPKRLKQILVNLLSNAVKFTEPGGHVSLEVTVEPAARIVRFVVQDNGIGITPEDLDRLFQPFTQVDSSLSRQYEGSGLGLVLVLRLAELHGGTVVVESAVDEGSRFTVILPYVVPPPAEVAPAPDASSTSPQGLAAPQLAPASSTVRILLAEDNELNILSIRDYLEAKGYQMTVARNGREALERATADVPDLILMDIQMPEMDGLEATRQLRAMPALAATPIIALTALAMSGDRERCLDAGANAYLTKPVSLKGLTETILEQLHA